MCWLVEDFEDLNRIWIENVKNNLKREEEKENTKKEKYKEKQWENVTITKIILEMMPQMQYYLHRLCN